MKRTAPKKSHWTRNWFTWKAVGHGVLFSLFLFLLIESCLLLRSNPEEEIREGQKSSGCFQVNRKFKIIHKNPIRFILGYFEVLVNSI